MDRVWVAPQRTIMKSVSRVIVSEDRGRCALKCTLRMEGAKVYGSDVAKAKAYRLLKTSRIMDTADIYAECPKHGILQAKRIYTM